AAADAAAVQPRARHEAEPGRSPPPHGRPGAAGGGSRAAHTRPPRRRGRARGGGSGLTAQTARAGLDLSYPTGTTEVSIGGRPFRIEYAARVIAAWAGRYLSEAG